MPSAPIRSGVGLGPGGQVRDGGLEVLDPVGGVFQAAGLAAALALVGGVEREGDEPLLGQPTRVKPRGLFLDTAARVPDDDRRTRAGGGAVGSVEMAGEGDAGAVEGDVSPGHGNPRSVVCTHGRAPCPARCRARLHSHRDSRGQKGRVPAREGSFPGKNPPSHLAFFRAQWMA